MQLARDEKYTKIERKFFKNHQNLIEKYSKVLKKMKERPYRYLSKITLFERQIKRLSCRKLNL